jgi:hypothetical protein
MSAELRQVTDGFDYRVRSYSGYDINGYHFWMRTHEASRPNRKTTNSGVFTPGLDNVEYYGRIEEIYELSFHGSKPLNPVIFKCHWFDPEVTRRTYSNFGLVEVQQDSVLPGDDVYIVAQQAIYKFIISHMRAKPRSILRVGMLCTRYHRMAKYLSQSLRITT